MKTVILFFLISFSAINANGQVELDQKSINQNEQSIFIPVTYRLFPTQNMRIFIKLNTRNGQMWLVQFDVEDENRFETYLNILPLVENNKEADNRFTLYPTQNIWTFILLDQIDGRTWQVQWSFEPENRFVIPIE